jgi:hypothetical protein
MKKTIIFLSLFVFSFLSFANEVSSDALSGAVVAISPDRHWMALVESFKSEKIPDDCDADLTEDGAVDQIWLYDLETPRKSVLVSPSFTCDDPEIMIMSIDKLQFSLDSKTLYFETSAWAVSGALHAVDLDGRHLRYIAPSNDFSIISGGMFSGDLAIFQHRYLIPLIGDYQYWAYTPEGKELGLIGPDLSGFDDEEKDL